MSGGELYALYTPRYVCRLLLYISNSVEMATSDARGKQTSVYIHLHMCTLEGAWGSFDWDTFHNISSGHVL